MGLLYPILWEETPLRLLSAPFPHLPVPGNASRCDQDPLVREFRRGRNEEEEEGKGLEEGVLARSLGEGVLQMLRYEESLGDHLILFR